MEIRIGQHAGLVWQALKISGAQSPGTIGRTLELTRDEVARAIGWLAREGKLAFNSDSRGRLKVSLK